MCGVGPADSTGKSVVRYCPGGSFASAGVRRPEKPREMTAIMHSCLGTDAPQHWCSTNQSKASNPASNECRPQNVNVADLGKQESRLCRTAIRMVNASIATRSGGHPLSYVRLGVSISTRRPGSPTSGRSHPPRMTHKLRSHRNSAFATWFGYSRAPIQQQMRFESSSHSAPAPGLF
jgi:hypothetical protein